MEEGSVSSKAAWLWIPLLFLETPTLLCLSPVGSLNQTLPFRAGLRNCSTECDHTAALTSATVSWAKRKLTKDIHLLHLISESCATAVILICYKHIRIIGANTERCFMKINQCHVVDSVADFLSALCWIQLNWCTMLRHPAEIEPWCICYGRVRSAASEPVEVHS